jgi:hypothetical protein
MQDDELELLLDHARCDASSFTAERSRQVAYEIASRQHVKAATRRRRLRAGVLAPAGVALMAVMGAGTYAAYQLSVPPFVSTEPGVERVTEPITVDYRTDAGTVLDCELYLEFRDVTPEQRLNLNELSKNPMWRGFGQRTYDSLPAKNRAVQDGPEELWAARVNEKVYAEALDSTSGLTFRGPAGNPSLVGSTTRCDYPEGQR